MLAVRVELEFEDEVGDFDRGLWGIKSRASWKYSGDSLIPRNVKVFAGLEPTSGVSGVARAVGLAATVDVTIPFLSPASQIGPVRSHPNTGQYFSGTNRKGCFDSW
jgi:hypothetical protein